MTYEKQGLFVEDASIARYAENLARTWKPVGEQSGASQASALRRTLRALDAAHAALLQRWGGAATLPPAVRWMLDNHYLVRRSCLNAADDLRGVHRLRSTAEGCIVLLLCGAFLRCSRFEFSLERLAQFLSGVQKSLILDRSDFRALRAGLVQALCGTLLPLFDAPEAEDAERTAQNIITSLRTLEGVDLRELLDASDLTEQLLRQDPAGVYPSMEQRSRQAYRDRLALLAERRGTPEHKAAELILKCCRSQSGLRAHVGYWLYRVPMGEPCLNPRGGGYIALNVLTPLFFALLFGFLTKSPLTAVLLLLPLSELCKRLCDALLLHTSTPTHLPRLALSGGVPAAGKTLCVVSALLTGEAEAAALAAGLERARLLSRDAGRNLLFALLADLPETAEAELPGAGQWIAAAQREIEALNGKYGGGFFLLTRPRVYSADKRYLGWERKRGALLETMQLLRGKDSAVTVTAGDADALRETRYLLALDSDTALSPGAARALIATALHPLNAAAVDRRRGIVTEGYGIFAPRVETSLEAANATDFARVFAGQGGTDPYGGAASELYMDLWRRGGFAGKGLIDIDAYLACMEHRVPENRMLSHDAVEGAFLRCGYVSEVALCDGFPGSVLSYLRREERWVRGDWQNCIWLFRRGRALHPMERWKLFDALRRSLLPVSALTAIVLSFFLTGQGVRLSAVIALFAMCAELMQTSAETLFLPQRDGGVRYHSAVLVGFGAALVRTLLRLILLPAEGTVCLAAALRALWRLGISHRNLLQWQTAAQSAAHAGGLFRFFIRFWFAEALGAALLLFSPAVLGRAAGILWLLSPVCAWLLSLPAVPDVKRTPEETAALRRYAEATWRYFHDFLTSADNFLPPDNYQAQPPIGLAHRTSPTNIGFALLSVLGAADLKLITPAEAFRLTDGTLSTLERLPKWHGHIYNWYDTRSLQPLSPRYVSTVDSGNLCAALYAAAAGLREYGNEPLAARAQVLADRMEFAPLFDRKRQLFTIGWDVETDRPTPSWYDLMASEARLTGFLAVARSDVPTAHWRSLSRAQVQLGAFRGLASWTGTMFEYLMPELLLPPKRGSLLWESARFCLFAQRRRTKKAGLPWGCSESAYAALDPALVYRYKAHGCAALALKRGQDEELVISPYSSFLALSVQPAAALKNLAALEGRGAFGSYGFWEALDFTPDRGGSGGTAVQCVMAHHQGMSMVAAVNLLCGDCMRRRFFSYPAMAAYSGLLEERIAIGGTTLRRRQAADTHGRPPKRSMQHWEQCGEGTDFRRPDCCLLAGQNYSLLCTETGLSRPLWGAVSPYAPGAAPTVGSRGVDIFLEGQSGTLSLLPTWGQSPELHFRHRFTEDTAELTGENPLLTAQCAVKVSPEGIGEVREITLRSHSDRDEPAVLCLRFRPLLARFADYQSHPAYYGLGISVQTEGAALLIRRLARGKTPELWMALACDRACSAALSTGREETCRDVPPQELFLCGEEIMLRAPLLLSPGKGQALRFALAMAYTRADALRDAEAMLRAAGAAALPRTAAAMLGMSPAAVGESFSLLPELYFPGAAEDGAPQSALWKFGISGDLPIVCAAYTPPAQLPSAKALLDTHLFLCGCGADFDLVFLSNDGASYHKPLQTALTALLHRSGGELLRDRRGGVHILEQSPETDCIAACAVKRIDLTAPEKAPERCTDCPDVPFPPVRRTGNGQPLRYRWLPDGSFAFFIDGALPPRAWQNLLTNGSFGYLATDCGTGHLWAQNAREYQLTPWRCDPTAVSGPETLRLSVGGTTYSLFAAQDGFQTDIRFDFGSAVWEKRMDGIVIRMTAFVPFGVSGRVLLLRFAHVPGDAVLQWEMPLQLAAKPEDARYCRITAVENGLRADNPRSGADAKPFYALSGAGAVWESTGLHAAPGSPPTMRMTVACGQALVLVCGCDAPEKLAALCTPDRAEAALGQTRSAWRRFTHRLWLQSPDEALNRYLNGWAACQTLSGRILGRCSVYQSGGAFGFRDQLQDAANLILFDAAICKNQILRACLRQYEQGDVQHWWHQSAASARGIRTRCSDDLLWLPWAVAEYVEKTGDRELLRQTLPYLSSPPLESHEKDRYESPPYTQTRESVAAHCLRAICCVMQRGVGSHGLLRMGSGDWNDGFDAVGGESVWLSWFFLHVVRRFASLCPPEAKLAGALEAFCSALQASTENTWCGGWYLRGYYADGTPLGAPDSAECRIDSVAQSWAVLSGAGDRSHAAAALDSAVSALYDAENRLVRLFTPPFAGKAHPGYIECYGPGFRENGGQYTHAALWLAQALLRSGETDRGWALLSALLPSGRPTAQYKGEPFVLAADVYTADGHVGEAGWTWYTGSAGWMLRIAAEDLLGLQMKDGLLYLRPKLPSGWNGCRLSCLGLEIEVTADGITVDGQPYGGEGLKPENQISAFHFDTDVLN